MLLCVRWCEVQVEKDGLRESDIWFPGESLPSVGAPIVSHNGNKGFHEESFFQEVLFDLSKLVFIVVTESGAKLTKMAINQGQLPKTTLRFRHSNLLSTKVKIKCEFLRV